MEHVAQLETWQASQRAYLTCPKCGGTRTASSKITNAEVEQSRRQEIRHRRVLVGVLTLGYSEIYRGLKALVAAVRPHRSNV